MKRLRLFKKFNEKIFNDEHFELKYPENFNINKMFLDMDKENIPLKKIDGLGTFLLVKDTSIPYMMFVPEVVEETDRLVMESNNYERDSREDFILQAVGTLKRLNTFVPHPVPLLVPLIPGGDIYYQQLSSEALFSENPRRIDNEVDEVIKDALNRIEDISGKRLDDKIFLHGYSSSGVFAQRFCLLHPERVDSAVIGGASGTIPALDGKISYPLGCGNIKNFNLDEYKNIKFKYYVGEYELIDEADNRRDIVDGRVVKVKRPMHDMSYYQRSVNAYIGKEYRDKYGSDYFDRIINIVNDYKRNGIDINSTVIRGRAHKPMTINNKKYKSAGEGIEPIVESAYRKSIVELSKQKIRSK